VILTSNTLHQVLLFIYRKNKLSDAKAEYEEKVNKYAGLENVTREIIAAGIVEKLDLKEILDLIVTKLPKNKVCQRPLQ
jgi:hypothetical protein